MWIENIYKSIKLRLKSLAKQSSVANKLLDFSKQPFIPLFLSSTALSAHRGAPLSNVLTLALTSHDKHRCFIMLPSAEKERTQWTQ